MGGGIAPDTGLFHGVDGDPGILLGIQYLQFIVLALGFVPGKGVDIVALIRAVQIQRGAQQILPDHTDPAMQISLEDQIFIFPEHIEGKLPHLAVGGHGIISALTKGNDRVPFLQNPGGLADHILPGNIHPHRLIVRHIKQDLNGAVFRIHDPVQIFHLGRLVDRGHLQIFLTQTGALLLGHLIPGHGSNAEGHLFPFRQGRDGTVPYILNIIGVKDLGLTGTGILGDQNHIVVGIDALRPGQQQCAVFILR